MRLRMKTTLNRNFAASLLAAASPVVSATIPNTDDVANRRPGYLTPFSQ